MASSQHQLPRVWEWWRGGGGGARRGTHIPRPGMAGSLGKVGLCKWLSGEGGPGLRKARLGARPGKPRLIPQSSHSVKRLVYPGDCSLVGHDGLSAGPFVMLTAADQWIEVRTSDVGASLEGKKSQRFIFSRLVTLRSLIFSPLASAALKWILISALMQTCQINFADLGYDWPKIASASVLCSKPMNFNHGQNGLVAFFVRNLNRKGLNCKCQGMMLFCSFQKLMWWRSKKLLCRVYSWQMLWEASQAAFCRAAARGAWGPPQKAHRAIQSHSLAGWWASHGLWGGVPISL